MTPRIDILANDRASFVRPMAEGLTRMLRACGADARLHYDGLAHLMLRQRPDTKSAKSLASSIARLESSRRQFRQFLKRLHDTDVIVVVANVPGSFSRSLLLNIERLREHLPDVPIVNYDLHYLPTLDSWARHILRGGETALPQDAAIGATGYFGLDRFDWYLMASIGTYVPLPDGPQPVSLIGIDLDDGTLYPEQTADRGRVLLDFEQLRGRYPEYREVQLEALRLSGLEYEVLAGAYSIPEIRAIYRRTSIFLLASSEAFGLPIVELQACGSLIFLPDPYWACAHWLGDDFRNPKRTPELSPNFVVYENDPTQLAALMVRRACEPHPARVRETLLASQPWLFRGDLDALRDFLGKVKCGTINSRTHQAHFSIGRTEID